MSYCAQSGIRDGRGYCCSWPREKPRASVFSSFLFLPFCSHKSLTSFSTNVRWYSAVGQTPSTRLSGQVSGGRTSPSFLHFLPLKHEKYGPGLRKHTTIIGAPDYISAWANRVPYPIGICSLVVQGKHLCSGSVHVNRHTWPCVS